MIKIILIVFIGLICYSCCPECTKHYLCASHSDSKKQWHINCEDADMKAWIEALPKSKDKDNE